MNLNNKLHQAKLSEWASRFADQKASGLTIHEWCDANGISFHKYNYWKHQLKQEVVNNALPDIVPVSLSAAPVQAASSFETSVIDSGLRANCAIRAMLPITINGISFELDPSVTEDFLSTLIRAVRHA